MGSMVEHATNKAMAALIRRRPELALEVIAGDDGIDRKELEVEAKCLKILALHQPVAGDLRFIVGCIKVNNDLQRMGDHATNIAEDMVYMAGGEIIRRSRTRIRNHRVRNFARDLDSTEC